MASILETFYLLFESNADKVKKGATDAERSTKDLESSLGAVDRAGGLLGEHLLSTFTEIGAALAGVFSVGKIIEEVRAVAEANDQLGKTSQRLNIAVEDLDAWNQAAQRASGGTANFVGTLDYLNRGMADIATKGTSRLKPFFDELKIRVTDAPHHVRPLLSILGDLADKLSVMDRQQAAGIGEKLGIDEGTMLMLAAGRRGLDDLVQRQREIGTVTKEDTEIAERFNDQWEDTQQIFRNIATAIGNSVLPAISDFLKWVERAAAYLREHKPLIEGFFIGVAGVITTVFLPSMIEAVVAVATFIAEFLLVPAIILAVGAAFALAYEDVQQFLAGNKSVIGELSKKWPWLGDVVRESVKGIGESWHWLTDYVVNGWTLLKNIIGLMANLAIYFSQAWIHGFQNTTTALANMFPFWAKVFRGIGELVSWLIGLLEKAVGYFLKFGAGAVAALPKALGKWAKDVGAVSTAVAVAAGSPAAVAQAGASPAAITRPGEAPAPATAAALAAGKGAVRTADTSPFSAAATQLFNRGGDTKKEYNITVNVGTITTQASDAKDISTALTDHFADQLRQTLSHYDDGVKS